MKDWRVRQREENQRRTEGLSGKKTKKQKTKKQGIYRSNKTEMWKLYPPASDSTNKVFPFICKFTTYITFNILFDKIWIVVLLFLGICFQFINTVLSYTSYDSYSTYEYTYSQEGHWKT